MSKLCDEQQIALIGAISSTATQLQSDALHLAPRVALERGRFSDEITLEEMSFWYKCLIHAILSFAEGLTYTIRLTLKEHATLLTPNVTQKQLGDIEDLTRRLPLERALRLSFRVLPLLFGTSFVLDTGAADYRAFKAIIQARARFTHPKTPPDIHPLESLAAMNSALEWLLVSWRELLLTCSRAALGVTDTSRVTRRYPFSDQRLTTFQQLAQEHYATASANAVSNFSAMILGLMNDTLRAASLVQDASDQTEPLPKDLALRNLVRFLFTEIEGSVFVAASYLHRYGFAADEVSSELLIGSHEDVRMRIAEILEEFSRCFGNDCPVSRSGAGWDAFCLARDLRNRLLHPSAPSDLNLGPEEVDLVQHTRQWWHGEVHQCLDLSQSEEKLRVFIERYPE